MREYKTIENDYFEIEIMFESFNKTLLLYSTGLTVIEFQCFLCLSKKFTLSGLEFSVISYKIPGKIVVVGLINLLYLNTIFNRSRPTRWDRCPASNNI